MFLGLRSLIYPAPDLDAAKQWYTDMLGFGPYYDEPDYVGFDLGGYELGLFPHFPEGAGPYTYWGVANVDDALAHLLDSGATLLEEVSDVGGGLRMASVTDPAGFVFGIIENPSFALKEMPPEMYSPGPGR